MRPHPLLPAECQARYLAEGIWSGETLMDLLLQAARQGPDRPLYVAPLVRTYREVAADALGLAAHLQRAGLGPGDAVVAPRQRLAGCGHLGGRRRDRRRPCAAAEPRPPRCG